MSLASSSVHLDNQAVLLLCADFGRFDRDRVKPLSIAEYNRIASQLKSAGMRPADLLDREVINHLATSTSGIDGERLQALIERGALMGMVLERWEAQGIWTLCRLSEEYPSLLKHRLRDKAPPILYGIGDRSVLQQGGLAIVGSRNPDDEALEYTRYVAESCVRDGWPVVSGGAKGIDRTAMLSACDAGGVAIGVTAEPLVKAAVSSFFRSAIREGMLTLITPFDPEAAWSTVRAMQRNKYVYCMANMGLVVSAGVKGGTWEGAREALASDWRVPVYVRPSGCLPPGNSLLIQQGAIPFPEPPWSTSLPDYLRFHNGACKELVLATRNCKQLEILEQNHLGTDHLPLSGYPADASLPSPLPQIPPPSQMPGAESPHDAYSAVLPLLLRVLKKPLSNRQVAKEIDVKESQAKEWLVRAKEEGRIKVVNRGKYVSA